MIEQAKGILMARHMINADAAFGMLRNHSQTNGRKLIDIAEVLSPATRCCSPERRNRCPSRKPRVVSTEVPPYRGNVEAGAERWPFEPNTVAGMTMFRRSRRGETSLTTRAVTSSAFGFCLQ
jgi:hypothetical protein